MKTNKILFFAVILLSFFSCQEKKQANVHNKGEITLQYDDAYINVAKELAYRYEQVYPDTKINLKVSKEDQALEDLLNKKVDAIIMSRDLTDTEKEYWQGKLKAPLQVSYFAADAVVFAVSKNSKKEFITLEEIEQMLKSDDKKLIFEGVNTSNFNVVIQKFGLSPQEVHYSRLANNEKIVQSLEKFPNHIGVIGFNTLSNPYRDKEKSIRENIKILPIKVGEKLIYPKKETLKNQEYPFTKLLYFLTNEIKFGLANGFIRYSCTSIGQKIVDKEGLQPYYLFPRTVKINNQN